MFSLAGSAEVGLSPDFALARYNANGSLDNAFGSFGRVATDIASGSQDAAIGMVLQPDGKIVTAGYAVINTSSAQIALVRYNSNGTLDPTFGTNGKVTTSIGLAISYGFSLALQTDGKMIVAGAALIGASAEFAAARYRTDGSLDDSYGFGGKVVVDFGDNGANLAYTVALDSMSRAVIAGDANGVFGVARLLGDPFLQVSRTSTNTVLVSWPSPSTGFNLQQTTDLNTTNWSVAPEFVNDNGTNRFIIVNPPAGNRFYRLRKP